jgi:hypothetical protein
VLRGTNKILFLYDKGRKFLNQWLKIPQLRNGIAEDMAQVIERLPNKHEAMSSKPSSTQKKNWYKRRN